MNHQSGQGDDTFWPSFTDVMTVIVMIFLLAMVIVMIRNSELVQQLRTTMEAERTAAELARTTSLEKEDLAMRLIEAEQQISMLRLEHMNLVEQRDTARLERDTRNTELDRLRSDYKIIETNLKATAHTLKQTTDRLTQITRQRETLTTQLATSQKHLAQLQQEHEAQARQLQSARLESRQSTRQLSTLTGEYDALKVKYDKLIKPARTAKGKYVVEVRAIKQGADMAIEMKRPNDPGFVKLTAAKMHEQLQALKKQYPESLYVKIIFPEESGLSYNEAWSFTTTLHSRYDYYYQE